MIQGVRAGTISRVPYLTQLTSTSKYSLHIHRGPTAFPVQSNITCSLSNAERRDPHECMSEHHL